MNQILMTEGNAPKDNFRNKRAPKDKTPKEIGITSVVRFFAVLILIFGLALVGNGTYAMMQELQSEKSNNIPEVTTQIRGKSITIKIKCENGIKNLRYSWNDSVEKLVQGNNRKELEETISAPTGDSKLNISVINSNGKQTNFVKNIKVAENDTTEPTIDFEVVNANVKIIVTDDTALDYIVYKYGDNAEVKIEATQEGQTKIETTIPVTQGQSTLKVEAIDKSQNYATKEQEVKGAKKPTIEVNVDPNDYSYVIIKAKDEDGLRMISYYINGTEYKTDPNISLNMKEFEYRQKVDPGENKITIHAYNINEQVTEFIGTYDYKQ